MAVYKSNLLPVLDYCCPAFHSMLTDYQDEALESVQSRALQIIYGYDIPAGEMRRRAGITTLRARRIDLTDKFAQKILLQPRFAHWFPERPVARTTRSSEQYLETYARCERLKNSPVFYMRRRLNGKEGKTYGVRNKQYREA